MRYALTEVETMARKAARGAGLSWGMAEEAGMAARWLCAMGLDGCAALAEVLDQADAAAAKARAPVTLRSVWHASSGTLCPLATGAALADAATLWQASGLEMAHVTRPVLLLPFAAQAVRALGAPVQISWDGVEAVADADHLSLQAASAGALHRQAACVRLRANATLGRSLPHYGRAEPQEADWRRLNSYAARTYAPETAESRLKGAGAGLSDND